MRKYSEMYRKKDSYSYEGATNGCNGLNLNTGSGYCSNRVRTE